MNFGIWTILPMLLVLFVAIKTKKVIESLLLGCISSYVIIAIFTKQNLVVLLMDSFFRVVTDYDNQWLLFVCGLFGSLMALLNASKATTAIARLVKKTCKTEKGILMFSWILGILLFIDDYMNILTISSCMNKLSDEYKVPRESLAFVIDSTGAPTCVLVPFSTWAVFFADAFYKQQCVQDLKYGSAISTYIHAIPYMFYAFAALLIVPMFIMGIIPKFGAMKEAYERKKREIDFTERGAKYLKNIDEVESKAEAIDFIIPIGVMIIITVVVSDMFLALLLSIAISILLYVVRGILSIDEVCELWIKGFADMIPTLAIMLFAFYMREACNDIYLPNYVISNIAPLISRNTFPVIAFIIVCCLAFVTGDNWGVPSICVPIIMPLAKACNANLLLIMGAVVSGAVFGSHACFYSDATVLTSSACEIDNMSHARTQLPYAMIAMMISVLAYAIFGKIM
jgi:Na+/H+ antiporter NhaC